MQRCLLATFLFSIVLVVSANAGGFKANTGKADNIEVTSDRLDVFSDKRESVFRGNVEATKGDIRLNCGVLHLFLDEKTHKVDKLVAEEDVKIFWQDRQASCSKATYLLAEDKIIMTGNVIITRGKEMLSADKVVFDMKSKHQVVEGNEKSRVKIKVETDKETGILKWEH